jgi:hypothetical protein
LNYRRLIALRFPWLRHKAATQYALLGSIGSDVGVGMSDRAVPSTAAIRIRPAASICRRSRLRGSDPHHFGRNASV